MDFHQTACILILWRSGLGLLMGIFFFFFFFFFFQFLTTLSAQDTSTFFLYPVDKLSKWQWIFTKLGICIDIVVIWFGIANAQISLTFDRVIYALHDNGGVLSFYIFISTSVLGTFWDQRCVLYTQWDRITKYPQHILFVEKK